MLHENLIGKKYIVEKQSIEHECIEHLQIRKQGARPKFAIGASFLGKTRENEYGFRIIVQMVILKFNLCKYH